MILWISVGKNQKVRYGMRRNFAALTQIQQGGEHSLAPREVRYQLLVQRQYTDVMASRIVFVVVFDDQIDEWGPLNGSGR